MGRLPGLKPVFFGDGDRVHWGDLDIGRTLCGLDDPYGNYKIHDATDADVPVNCKRCVKTYAR
jgi:hypothetical protein